MTLCIDEADEVLQDASSDLYAVLNSGHRKAQAYVWRTVEIAGEHIAKQFPTWAPIQFAGIGSLHKQTLTSRSITLRMTRAMPGEVKAEMDNGQCPDLETVRRKLARWAYDILELPNTKIPESIGLNNRVRDNWRPLCRIAEAAGGSWPERAAQAAKLIQEQGISSTGKIRLIQLLSDIRTCFGGKEKIHSSDILIHLINLEDGPYSECHRGKSITPNWLATQLQDVIKGGPRQIKISGKNQRGYERSQFEDAWKRYIPSTKASVEHSECYPVTSGMDTGFQAGPPSEEVAVVSDTCTQSSPSIVQGSDSKCYPIPTDAPSEPSIDG
jgi:putative DNA primase/helicase